ncbi:MAG: O-antigen ligase family protein [Candidatus Nomurabacteria bacterium]
MKQTNNTSYVIRLSKFFLLASIATTFVKIPSFHQYYRMSDLFLLISFIFITNLFFNKYIDFKKNKNIIVAILFIIATNILGTILSYLIYKTLPLRDVLLNYARLSSCIMIYYEIIIISQVDKTFIKKSIICLMGSLIIIPISHIMKKIGIIDYLMFDPTRFSGLLIDPNYFANFQIIPTILLLYFAIKDNNKYIYKILAFIGFMFSISMILWSGSRSGILGLIVAIFLLFFFYIKFTKTSIFKILITILILILSFPIGTILIPRYKNENLQTKTSNENNQQSLIIKDITSENQKTRLESFSNISDAVTSNDRLLIWKSSIKFIKQNPFGYGPGYNQIINLHGDVGSNRVVHNFELELILQGGLLLFIFINYSLLKLLIKTYNIIKFKYFNEIHALVSIMIGLLISGLFLDSMPEKWVWIILALIVSYNIEEIIN